MLDTGIAATCTIPSQVVETGTDINADRLSLIKVASASGPLIACALLLFRDFTGSGFAETDDGRPHAGLRILE